MSGSPTDPRRIEVWVAMAEHFLDTETRHQIPLTALRCTAAALTVAETRRVWRVEVTPAVGFNRWPFSGVWTGWDDDWLVAEIESRKRADVAPFFGCDDGVIIAIERCMEILVGVEGAAERAQLACDLAWLARHFFGFSPEDPRTLSPDALARLRALYPDPSSHALSPALVRGELARADQRVRTALALERGKPQSWVTRLLFRR
jgi:hypothetical protein